MLHFPLAVLDFEASSLEDDSYPIEVGLAVIKAFNAPLEVWSTLIAPAPEWARVGNWSRASQKVHGIGRHELEWGTSVKDAANMLNAKCSTAHAVWCDGGEYDSYWMKRLYSAAHVLPSFKLINTADLFLDNIHAEKRFAQELANSVPEHRAGADARRLCSALIEAFSDAGPHQP